MEKTQAYPILHFGNKFHYYTHAFIFFSNPHGKDSDPVFHTHLTRNQAGTNLLRLISAILKFLNISLMYPSIKDRVSILTRQFGFGTVRFLICFQINGLRYSRNHNVTYSFVLIRDFITVLFTSRDHKPIMYIVYLYT